MAHFAEMKSSDNKVLRVVVISNQDVNNNGGELSTTAETWVANNIDQCPLIREEQGGTYPSTYWKQTSYNNNFRGKFAFLNSTYDSVNDVFVEPKPFDSWVLKSNKYEWEAPIADPDPNKETYKPFWDEDNVRWLGVKISDKTTWSWDPNTSTWSEVIE